MAEDTLFSCIWNRFKPVSPESLGLKALEIKTSILKATQPCTSLPFLMIRLQSWVKGCSQQSIYWQKMQLKKKGTNDKHTLQTNQLNTLRTALPCGGSGNINNSCLKNESVQSSLQIMNSMKYHPLPIPMKKVSLHNQTQKYTIQFTSVSSV